MAALKTVAAWGRTDPAAAARDPVTTGRRKPEGVARSGRRRYIAGGGWRWRIAGAAAFYMWWD
jgi:hypothetical protein